MNEAERDKMLLNAYNNTPEFYKTLVEDFRDPSGANRLPVVLQIDATYIDMCSSIDPGKPKSFTFKKFIFLAKFKGQGGSAVAFYHFFSWPRNYFLAFQVHNSTPLVAYSQ